MNENGMGEIKKEEDLGDLSTQGRTMWEGNKIFFFNKKKKAILRVN